MSIATATVPDEWKHARVVCIHKNGDKTAMDNYRPLSILPIVSKILERVIQKQMVQYLEETEQLSQFQCGFRKHHSTHDVVTYFKDCTRKGIDKGCFTGTVYIDMRKAFDSVDHLLLLEKLGKLGIVEHEQRWFSHYLSNRKQSVLYEGVLSEPEEIRSGVPQGSILEPIDPILAIFQ